MNTHKHANNITTEYYHLLKKKNDLSLMFKYTVLYIFVSIHICMCMCRI